MAQPTAPTPPAAQRALQRLHDEWEAVEWYGEEHGLEPAEVVAYQEALLRAMEIVGTAHRPDPPESPTGEMAGEVDGEISGEISGEVDSYPPGYLDREPPGEPARCEECGGEVLDALGGEVCMSCGRPV